MSDNPVKPVASLMQTPALARIGATLALHRRVLEFVRQALPAHLARHCLDCVVKADSLILYTDSPLFSSQLRFYTAQLRETLQVQHSMTLATIQVRNRCETGRPTAPRRFRVVPSTDVVNLLQSQAAVEPESELGTALGRLGETLSRLNRTSKP